MKNSARGAGSILWHIYPHKLRPPPAACDTRSVTVHPSLRAFLTKFSSNMNSDSDFASSTKACSSSSASAPPRCLPRFFVPASAEPRAAASFAARRASSMTWRPVALPPSSWRTLPPPWTQRSVQARRIANVSSSQHKTTPPPKPFNSSPRMSRPKAGAHPGAPPARLSSTTTSWGRSRRKASATAAKCSSASAPAPANSGLRRVTTRPRWRKIPGASPLSPSNNSTAARPPAPNAATRDSSDRDIPTNGTPSTTSSPAATETSAPSALKMARFFDFTPSNGFGVGQPMGAGGAVAGAIASFYMPRFSNQRP
mmetsp:Transcript_100947/g.290297  ORF Transcript_100947/g.290297 Transcript_100947/m.290297 type:complete len:312 (+) Transcript_100947:608-1543(+)